ncbi:hypothetical protein NLJ89_g11500 [Agrocybe chaxingu]|uniref:V-SNARE coiled-coil homology domain-containing protein n=1 Tax=Agrocybe chaxingu TaxID=84603 RepID=A0A9W8MPY5_9AGAR|nr:hypothetical protein NLJ89_g11500 [Agrocybe chaxingu]
MLCTDCGHGQVTPWEDGGSSVSKPLANDSANDHHIPRITSFDTVDPHAPIMSEPYDPYLPRNGTPAGPSAGPSQGNAKTAAIQAQIDDTVGIMRENITKVAERGERLEALQDKTDNLAVSAQGFRRGANRVRKNMWWKDMKMRIIIGAAIVIILVIIIVSIVKATQNK